MTKKINKSINPSICSDVPYWVPEPGRTLGISSSVQSKAMLFYRGKEAGKQMLRHSEWWQVRSRTMQPALRHNRPENQAEQQSAATQCSIPSRQTMSLAARILGKGLRPASPAWWAVRAVSRLRLHGATSPCFWSFQKRQSVWCVYKSQKLHCKNHWLDAPSLLASPPIINGWSLQSAIKFWFFYFELTLIKTSPFLLEYRTETRSNKVLCKKTTPHKALMVRRQLLHRVFLKNSLNQHHG